MDEYRSRQRHRPQERQPHSISGEGIQFLLRAEEQILQSISGRAPLPEVLNEICTALDCQIGNTVSLIILRDDEATDLAAIAGTEKHLGLHTFCCAAVVAENDELLGTLEMYCCSPRSPSPEEIQLIERATCLAAIAIERDIEAGHHANGLIQENLPGRGNVHPGLVYEN